MIFSKEELRKIAIRLEEYDAVFSQLWQLGRPLFDKKVPTAAVSFDEVGQVINLHINPTYWKSLKDVQKDFVICHEMLHVILEHGRRSMNCAQKTLANVAMDIVVNHLLVSGFGFIRADIDPKNKYCWRDTVFKHRRDIVSGQPFEYYFNKLKQQLQPLQQGGIGADWSLDDDDVKSLGKKVLDDHSRLPRCSVDRLGEKVSNNLSEEELQKLNEKLGNDGEQAKSAAGKLAGTSEGGFIKTMERLLIPKKRKWESVIKKCLKNMIGEGPEEQWLGANRRLAAMDGHGAILPVENDAGGPEQKRAVVYMFLDTSGSCEHLADRFWRLACSIPRDSFDVKFRCFDTRIYEVSPKDRQLFGFGGTRFHIIEDHIQFECQGKRYPDGVFVITDGYGDNVSPQFPAKWHILLTEDGRENCFPPDVKFYDLRQFE